MKQRTKIVRKNKKYSCIVFVTNITQMYVLQKIGNEEIQKINTMEVLIL